MHLLGLNITELLQLLWRGLFPCDADDSVDSWDWAVLKGEVWKKHGKAVADATPYLPGSFDRPPRNPAEKISSGYKAQEFITWIFGLGPALLRKVLPRPYWKNYCKLVRGVRLIDQRHITEPQLIEAHRLLIDFVDGFEDLYYQRKSSRLHFCRQSLHALPHACPEVLRLGPGAFFTQFTMERTIGNLGEEIKQPSNPYANLSQRGVRRCQVNALKVMAPEIAPEPSRIPQGAIDLGGGFVLLRGRDEFMRTIDGPQGQTIRAWMEEQEGDIAEVNWLPRVYRWQRLRLPNGQNARSKWQEGRKPINKVRMSRNVKFVSKQNEINYAEVQFFFQADIKGLRDTYALISVYSDPDAELLEDSENTVWLCTYRGLDALKVIRVKRILSVVGMVPLDDVGELFVVEKMGLELDAMGGAEDDMEEID
ncbi:hypothetical protein B0H16DRAFT_1347648 [Mycena metata]|uniref:Uncharacterized protein n=1 Tax=Mycena metata TaxID=1033252 RepID=A0AAD7GMK6_9AGAR|nr:hypothetical protein B0H16DRAFT_1347648 [Mycena metata]